MFDLEKGKVIEELSGVNDALMLDQIANEEKNG